MKLAPGLGAFDDNARLHNPSFSFLKNCKHISVFKIFNAVLVDLGHANELKKKHSVGSF